MDASWRLGLAPVASPLSFTRPFLPTIMESSQVAYSYIGAGLDIWASWAKQLRTIARTGKVPLSLANGIAVDFSAVQSYYLVREINTGSRDCRCCPNIGLNFYDNWILHAAVLPLLLHEENSRQKKDKIHKRQAYMRNHLGCSNLCCFCNRCDCKFHEQLYLFRFAEAIAKWNYGHA